MVTGAAKVMKKLTLLEQAEINQKREKQEKAKLKKEKREAALEEERIENERVDLVRNFVSYCHSFHVLLSC